MLEEVGRFDTGYTADSFEAVGGCRDPDGRPLVSVGTYQYYPEEGVRRGRLYLMAVGESL